MHDFKKIIDRKRCPKCGECIDLLRVMMVNSIFTLLPWQCYKCKSWIGYDNKFLFISFLVAVIIMLLPIFLFPGKIAVFPYVFIIAICYVLFTILFSKIELKNDKGN